MAVMFNMAAILRLELTGRNDVMGSGRFYK